MPSVGSRIKSKKGWALAMYMVNPDLILKTQYPESPPEGFLSRQRQEISSEHSQDVSQ